jgi:hypothetical protein
MACSSPKLTETRTNHPFELLSIREIELQLETFARNCTLFKHAKPLHFAHTVYLCVPCYSFWRLLYFWAASTDRSFEGKSNVFSARQGMNFKINLFCNIPMCF